MSKKKSIYKLFLLCAFLWNATEITIAQTVRVTYDNPVAAPNDESSGTSAPSTYTLNGFKIPVSATNIIGEAYGGGGGGGGTNALGGHGGGGGGGGYISYPFGNTGGLVVSGQVGGGGKRGETNGNADDGEQSCLTYNGITICAYGGAGGVRRGGGNARAEGGLTSMNDGSTYANGDAGASQGMSDGGNGGNNNGPNGGIGANWASGVGRNGNNPGAGGSGGGGLLVIGVNRPGGHGGGGRVNVTFNLPSTTIEADRLTVCAALPTRIRVTNPKPDALYVWTRNGVAILTTVGSDNSDNSSIAVFEPGAYRVTTYFKYEGTLGTLNSGVSTIAYGGSTYMGGYVNSILIGEDTSQDCTCANGTTIFLEDFGDGTVATLPYRPDKKIGRYLSGVTNLLNDWTGGGYKITKQVVGENQAWLDFATDYSISNGYMMAVNAAGNGGSFYEMTISDLCDVSKLYFSFKLANMMRIQAVEPNIKIELFNGDNHSQLLPGGTFVSGEIPFSTMVDWKTIGFTFQMPPGITSVYCKITDLQKCYNSDGTLSGDCNGNDLLIDDIRVQLCASAAEISFPTGNSTTVCGFTNLTARYNDDGTFGNSLVAQWEYSTTGNPNNPDEWSVLEGTQQPYTNNSSNTIIATDEGYYRFVVANPASIDNFNCRSMSRIVQFIQDNPQITLKCYEPEISTCELEYNLQASYVDDGTLGFLLNYYWEYSVDGNTQVAWTKITGTDGSTADGTLFSSYLAGESGYYRLAIERIAGDGCNVKSPSTHVKLNASPVLEINNPVTVPYGQTADITDVSVIKSVSSNCELSYWRDARATSEMTLEQAALIDATGVYFIKATNAAGCSTIKELIVTIMPDPLAPASNLKVNQHTRGTFASGLFIPSTTVSDNTINGRNCYQTESSEIYGEQIYTFAAVTSGIKNVRYYIVDNDGLVNSLYTRPYGSLTAGSLPAGSSVSTSIIFKDNLPAATNSSITLYIIYNNGTEDVKEEKVIYIQDTPCSSSEIEDLPLPECPALRMTGTQSAVKNGYLLSVSVGGGEDNTIEWYVDGEKQPEANSNSLTFVTAGKEPGLYVVKALLMSGCNCDIKVERFEIMVLPLNTDRSTKVSVYYDDPGTNTFTKPASLPMTATIWGGGGGSGRAVCRGLTLSIFDYVAVSGGGGGGGKSFGYIPQDITGIVTANVGAGGEKTSAGSAGNWDRPVAGDGLSTTISWLGGTVTANGGKGGKSAVARYVFFDLKGRTDVQSGGRGGSGNIANGYSAATGSGNNGIKVLNFLTQYATASSGGAAGQPGGGGKSCSSVGGHTGCPATIWNTNASINSNPGIPPGGGASGAARINDGIFNAGKEERVSGSDGANGRVLVEFEYLKPLTPVILSVPAINTYDVPVTLEIHNLTYDPADCEYQWYQNDVPISGATSKTYQVTSQGIYKVKVMRKGSLPPTISFDGATNIVISPNIDGSSATNTTLNIGNVRDDMSEYYSREITFK